MILYRGSSPDDYDYRDDSQSVFVSSKSYERKLSLGKSNSLTTQPFVFHEQSSSIEKVRRASHSLFSGHQLEQLNCLLDKQIKNRCEKKDIWIRKA